MPGKSFCLLLSMPGCGKLLLLFMLLLMLLRMSQMLNNPRRKIDVLKAVAIWAAKVLLLDQLRHNLSWHCRAAKFGVMPDCALCCS